MSKADLKQEQYDKVGIITYDDLINHLSTDELISKGIIVKGKDGLEYNTSGSPIKV